LSVVALCHAAHQRLWGFAKVRYRGLAKNANRAFAMLAMVNLVKWGRPLTG
jgi:IS5 family transposase